MWPKSSRARDARVMVSKVATRMPIAFIPEISPADRERHEQRSAQAAVDVPPAILALDALRDPTARAVLDLHVREPWSGYASATSWQCATCMNGDDREDWPCFTVEAVAKVWRIDISDAFLLARPTDGSLDACPACTWVATHQLGHVLPTLTPSPCEEHRP